MSIFIILIHNIYLDLFCFPFLLFPLFSFFLSFLPRAARLHPRAPVQASKSGCQPSSAVIQARVIPAQIAAQARSQHSCQPARDFRPANPAATPALLGCASQARESSCHPPSPRVFGAKFSPGIQCLPARLPPLSTSLTNRTG